MDVVRGLFFAGWTGVDLFFVLSGFLITGILWDAKGTPYYFRNFFARRTVRIFPLYYATLLVVFLIVPSLASLTTWLPAPVASAAEEQLALLAEGRRYWGWFATYLVDFLIAAKGWIYPAHVWTLAVEEHFYLIWPFLVFGLGRRPLIAVSLALVVAAPALRIWLVGRVDPVAIYVLTPCRMDGLALGAFLALLARGPHTLARYAPWARVLFPILGVTWLSLMIVRGGWVQYGPFSQTAGYTLTALFYGAFLVLALTSERLSRLLSFRPLRFLGKYSYALYLLHVFPLFYAYKLFAMGNPHRYSIVFSLARLQGAWPGAGLFILDAISYLVFAFGTSLALALASWHLLEKPCLQLKRFFPYREPARVRARRRHRRPERGFPIGREPFVNARPGPSRPARAARG